MSAISKPFVTFTNATTASAKVYVPVEALQSAEAIDIAAINNDPAKFFIVFTSLKVNGATKEIKVEFTSSAARNTSLANFKTAMATAIA